MKYILGYAISKYFVNFCNYFFIINTGCVSQTNQSQLTCTLSCGGKCYNNSEYYCLNDKLAPNHCGKYNISEKYCELGELVDPKTPWEYKELGSEYFMRTWDADKAAELIDKGLIIDPNFTQAYGSKSYFYLIKKNYQKSLENADMAMSLVEKKCLPDNYSYSDFPSCLRWQSYVSYGILRVESLNGLGRNSEALETYEMLKKIAAGNQVFEKQLRQLNMSKM